MTHERKMMWAGFLNDALWSIATVVAFHERAFIPCIACLGSLVTSLLWTHYWWRKSSIAPPCMVFGKDAFGQAVELEAKNYEQGKEIAGYIALIAAAKELGVYFHWEGRTARAEWSKEVLQQRAELPEALRSIHDAIVFSSWDFSSPGSLAWMYGIVCGWDEPAMREVSERFGWTPENVERLKAHHAAFADANRLPCAKCGNPKESSRPNSIYCRACDHPERKEAVKQ